MVTAAEHFDWAVGRAMEYVKADDGTNALASLVSDLGKHEDTASILNPALLGLFLGEVLIGGAQGARRFIEGIPRPEGQVVIVDHGPVKPPYGTPERADWDSDHEFDHLDHTHPELDIPPNAGSAS